MEVVGSKGLICVDAFKQHSLLYNDKEGKVEHIPWGEDMDQGLIDDFIRCLQQKGTPSISGEDGLRTLEVVQAAYQSNREGKVVSLVREL
jgi:UDP-N-acetylglucosamine 3-dehydrogenase